MAKGSRVEKGEQQKCADEARRASDRICNYIVVSEVGKPIWFRFGPEAEITRICGLLQALRSSALSNNLGELQTIHSPRHTLVFLTIQSITLLAIDYSKRQTEAFLRLQLEYIYAQIILAMTDQVQTYFRQDASFDLRPVLGSVVSILDCTAPVLTMGAATLPLQPELRHAIGQSLLAEPADNLLFAIVLAGTSLVTVVQPALRSLQLRAADLHLILLTLQKQSREGDSCLWLPLCLPHVHTSGFLHCLVHRLDEQLSLVLVSPEGSTEQLEALRGMKNRVRRAWGLDKDTTAKIDDDYVDVSRDGDRILPYLPEPELGRQLMQALAHTEQVSSLCNDYLELARADHFIFRLNVPIRNSPGHLTQCLSWPLAVENSVSTVYQRLCLRLRLGSSTEEASLDALDMICCDHGEAPTIGRDCPAMGLLEAPPNLQGVTYLTRGSETYLAMNGREFELYLVNRNALPAEQVAALAAKLTRRLLKDRDQLFLLDPLTWRE